MTTIEILGGKLHLTVKGIDVILAFKRHLEVPLENVRSAVVGVTAEVKARLHQSLRIPGTGIPGVITAGSYVEHGRWMFFDIHSGERAITIEVAHEHYDAIVVDVDDPAATVAKINHVLQR
jgi:hypothetical protein